MPDIAQTLGAAEAAAQDTAAGYADYTLVPVALLESRNAVYLLALAERDARRELGAAEQALRRRGVTHADQERAWDAKRAHEAARTALDAVLPEPEGETT